MRTTLYVDRNLLKEAMRLANTKKITEAVTLALKEFVHKRKIQELASKIGTLDLAITHTELEEMRRDE